LRDDFGNLENHKARMKLRLGLLCECGIHARDADVITVCGLQLSKTSQLGSAAGKTSGEWMQTWRDVEHNSDVEHSI
jgi:hypothetical protein